MTTTTKTWTPEADARLRAYLATPGRRLSTGLGSKESACSVAAINLALSGRLTDSIPDCMSAVIGRWIIVVQDAMPEGMRNGADWREVLPLAAGSGRERERERERLDRVLDWMWGRVLPLLQPVADTGGFGASWREMCAQRIYAGAAAAAAAYAAYAAADHAAYAAYAAAAHVAYAAAAHVAYAAYAAAAHVAYAAYAADHAAYAAAAGHAAYAAADHAAYAAADHAAYAAADHAAAEAAWERMDPVALLRTLVTETTP